MKRSLLVLISICSLCAALAFPLVSFAQKSQASAVPQHHHYKVVDLGTLGGPQSFLNEEGNPVFPGAHALNHAGAVAAISDASTPDPFNPNCYGQDCDTVHVFWWKAGVQTDLGTLPQNAPMGPPTPCLDCACSSWAYWISDSGLIAGVSENNAIDPLVGALASLAVLGKNGRITNLATLAANETLQVPLKNA